MNTIGERLKEERNKLGLSQSAIDGITGITKNSQINYEANKRSPDSEYLAKIAEIGADVNYILTGVRVATGSITKHSAANEVILSRDELDFVEMLRRVNEEQKNDALELVAKFDRWNQLAMQRMQN